MALEEAPATPVGVAVEALRALSAHQSLASALAAPQNARGTGELLMVVSRTGLTSAFAIRQLRMKGRRSLLLGETPRNLCSELVLPNQVGPVSCLPFHRQTR